MRDFAVLGQVEARIMAVESRLRFDIAAAEYVLGEKDIDEAIDVERNVPRRMGGIDRDDEIGPNALGFPESSANFTAQKPPMECPIRMIGSGSSR